MRYLSQEQVAGREKTLLSALLLSAWAPLATGLAVMLSFSTTQMADFIRRCVELSALFVSWWIFRRLARHRELSSEERARLEKVAAISISAALCCSGIALLLLALSRFSTFKPGGNVYPGLAVAVLGFITNLWFWRRYTRLTGEQYNLIIDAQRRLYRAKSFVDFCVIAALGAVAVNPFHLLTRYIDLSGAIALAIYLFWSGIDTAYSSRRVPAGDF
ncbi:MAG: transporter [Firmicutes bacterium]|nr:transporter [Bacillota bacterium]